MKIFIAAVILITINLYTIVPLIPRTNEEHVVKNIKHLKKYPWFQEMLSKERYKELIINDTKVRKTIGRFNTGKLNHNKKRSKYRKALQRILHQKTNYLA